ncbi:hypothetical protein [Candidatus Nitrosotalea sp. FS]|uniref:hypothetical protein n=1 Tax=Candidatus Nitrosotalea sp. FS TaxID=2341021 RepID=UPI001C4986EF|nr:hypothetical protein [Candidatus Nitrosotalea sp. FS]
MQVKNMTITESPIIPTVTQPAMITLFLGLQLATRALVENITLHLYLEQYRLFSSMYSIDYENKIIVLEK